MRRKIINHFLQIFLILSIVVCILGFSVHEKQKSLQQTENNKVIIAFIDSVCSTETKNFLADVLWINEDEIVDNAVDDDNNGYIDDIHGWNYKKNKKDVFTESEMNHGDYILQTFANTMDENDDKFDYEIMILNVLGEDGECSAIDLIQAVKYAESNGAKICNLSLSTYSDNKVLKQVIKDSNMFFVVAAGNESENLDDGFPSYPTNYRFNNVISVAAVDENDELLEISNYGKETVDVAANGIIEHDDYIIEGTSIATAKVTAVATKCYSSLTAEKASEELKEDIISLAEKNKKLSEKTISQGVIKEN